MSTEERLRISTGAAEFATALDGHRSALRAHCRRYVRDPDAVEDLVQDTIIRAWCARATFEGRSTLRTWLHQIATNVCLDALRRDRSAAWPVDPAAMGEASLRAAAGRRPSHRTGVPHEAEGSQPETAAVDNDGLASVLLVAVRHLPPRQRAVFVLRDALGWSAKETAHALDGSVAAANSALQRARATLRQRAATDPLASPAPRPPSAAELAALARCVHVARHGAPAGADPRAVGHLLGALKTA